MQRSGGSASAGSWHASIQFQTQPSTAWRRHISKMAAEIPVASPSPYLRCFRNGKEASTHRYSRSYFFQTT